MPEVTISIAMATYNGGSFLKQQLDSIYNQTVLPSEVIVCDDKSTDDTINILQLYKDKYHLKYFINDNKLGINKNFEKAIDQCSGDFIALSDQDDVWLPNKLDILVNTIKEYSNDLPVLVCSNSFKTDANLNVGGLTYTKKESIGINSFFFNPQAQGASMIINRKLKDIILPFPDGINMYDYYTAFLAEIFGKRIYITEPLMYYRIHKDNAFSGKYENIIKSYSPLERIIAEYEYFVPKSFMTVRTIIAQKGNKISKKNMSLLKSILYLESNDIGTFKKVFLILRYRFGGKLKLQIKLLINVMFNKLND